MLKHSKEAITFIPVCISVYKQYIFPFLNFVLSVFPYSLTMMHHFYEVIPHKLHMFLDMMAQINTAFSISLLL